MFNRYNKYILSIGADNLHGGAGGVGKYVITQQRLANENNIGYFYLFYVKKIIKSKMIIFRWGLILDNKYLGFFSTNQVKQIIKKNKINIDSVYLQHFIWSKVSEVDKILTFVNKKIYVLLHDYYTCCTKYMLVKNDVYCNANWLGDNSCLDCKNYKESINKEGIMWKSLNKFNEKINYISPSVCTKNIFLRFHPNIKEEKVIVVPNQNIIISKDDSVVKLNDKIRVAFLGNSNPMKGWDEYNKLVNIFKDKYDFYLFNSFGVTIDGTKTIHAKYDSNHLNGMVDFVTENNIDVVILWAKWPETFSYVACEALASKCYMIGYKDSGNIVDLINNYKTGKIYNAFNELIFDMNNIETFTNKINDYRMSTNNVKIELKDNSNIIVDLKTEDISKEKMNLLLPKNHLHIFNFILDKMLRHMFDMEEN